MNITTRTKTIISASVAGLALLGLTAIPALAHNYNQSETPSASKTTLAERQANPTPGQMNQMMETRQQMNQMMERCNSMMSMMQKMMGSGNMPGMMNHQNSQPGQERMNSAPRQ